ncbi:MAG: YlxR family protein [Elainella sp. C42_A2020_010]|nr:YlxR family protein [Elainella sp. C42_A2020_010]
MPPHYRRCISCRRIAHKSAFWRVVRVFPSHQVQLDQGMGRSVYLCRQASCLQAAQKKDRLGRSLKASVPEQIYQTLWQRLVVEADRPQLDPDSDEIVRITAKDSTKRDSAEG